MSLFKRLKTAEAIDFNALLGNMMIDRRHRSLYDRVRLKAGESMPGEVRLFNVPVGFADPFTGNVKDSTDTNMWMVSMLPAPYDQLVSRVLLSFQPTVSDADRNAILAGYTWNFWILEKRQLQEPVLEIAAVSKPEDLIEGYGQPGEDLSNTIRKLGQGVAWDLARENSVIYLAPLTQFKVTLTGTPFVLQNDLDFHFHLDGLMGVPIQ